MTLLTGQNRLAALRFYRILQRKCREFVDQPSPSSSGRNNLILLQPPLDPQRAGGVRITRQAEEARPCTILKLLTQLHRASSASSPTPTPLAEQALLHNWLHQVCHERDDLYRSQGEYFEDMDDDDFDVDEDIPRLWSTVDMLQDAIRMAFRHSPPPSADTFSMLQYNQWAIRAYQLLNQQLDMHRVTSISDCPFTQVRISATSCFIGRSLPFPTTAEVDYHFAYRIRIEHRGSSESMTKNNPAAVATGGTIQLLGRTWNIQEYHPKDDNGDEGNKNEPLVLRPQTVVKQPNGGAVGKLPVLQPGESFEYISGANLKTQRGCMSGAFHFAHVPPDTPFAVVGEYVEAFDAHDKRFEVAVNPFSLTVDEHNETEK